MGSQPHVSDTIGDDITLVGTTHISPESLRAVKEIIRKNEPDIVAVELGPRRYDGTLPEEVSIQNQSPSLRTLLFLPAMHHLQSRAAEEHGLESGKSDMSTAITIAGEIEARLALLDRDILSTFDQYWERAGKRELLSLLRDIGTASIRGDSLLFNITGITYESPKDEISVYLERLKNRFPAFHTTFVKERDEHMAKRLKRLKEDGYSVVAVVGAAHKPGIKQALTQDEVDMADGYLLLDPKPDIRSVDN